jgi:hypothetical protein
VATRCARQGRSGEMPDDSRRSRSHPLGRTPVLQELLVVGEQNHLLDSRLRQQDSIKRIGMQRREGANFENMRCSDRKLTESGVQCLFPESYRIHAEVWPAKAVLDHHLPYARNADQDVIGRVRDDVARLSTHRRRVLRCPEKYVGIQQIGCQGAPNNEPIAAEPI